MYVCECVCVRGVCSSFLFHFFAFPHLHLIDLLSMLLLLLFQFSCWSTSFLCLILIPIDLIILHPKKWEDIRRLLLSYVLRLVASENNLTLPQHRIGSIVRYSFCSSFSILFGTRHLSFLFLFLFCN